MCRHQKQVSMIYTTRDIILNALCYTLNFEVKGHGNNIDIYFLEFPDINLVDMNTKMTFLSHRHLEILNNV